MGRQGTRVSLLDFNQVTLAIRADTGDTLVALGGQGGLDGNSREGPLIYRERLKKLTNLVEFVDTCPNERGAVLGLIKAMNYVPNYGSIW